jgi:hypothetical protein
MRLVEFSSFPGPGKVYINPAHVVYVEAGRQDTTALGVVAAVPSPSGTMSGSGPNRILVAEALDEVIRRINEGLA